MTRLAPDGPQLCVGPQISNTHLTVVIELEKSTIFKFHSQVAHIKYSKVLIIDGGSRDRYRPPPQMSGVVDAPDHAPPGGAIREIDDTDATRIKMK